MPLRTLFGVAVAALAWWPLSRWGVPGVLGTLDDPGAVAWWRDELWRADRSVVLALGVVAAARALHPWSVLGRVAAFVAGSAALAWSYRAASGRPPDPLDLELPLLAALLLALWACPPIRRLATGLTPSGRRAFVALGTVLFAGQLAHDTYGTYPFATWGMYGGITRQTVSHYIYMEGTRADGTRERVTPFGHVPASGLRLETLRRVAADSTPEGAERLREMAAFLLDAENRWGEPLRDLRLVSCERTVFPRSERRSDPTCRTAVTVTLGESP